MQRYILLHRRLDNEATYAGCAAVHEPLADCQLFLSDRDDFRVAVSQSGSMRPLRADRSGGNAVRANTKGGGALVDVNRVVPLQDFSHPIDVLVWNPDGHHRRAAFETAVVDGGVVVRLASEQAAPKALPSSRVAAGTGCARCCSTGGMAAYGHLRH